MLLWGSRRGGDARQGETVLFQLPKDFDGFDEGSGVDTDAWRVRVLESVSWSTRTKPAFSKDGLDVYFAMTGNRFTGWNNGAYIILCVLSFFSLLFPFSYEWLSRVAEKMLIVGMYHYYLYCPHD